MADNVQIPSIAGGLPLNALGTSGFRVAESWGLWLLGHRSVLRLTAPAAQRAELDLKLYLPYDQQQVSLNLNGTAIFQTTRQPTAVGEFSSRLLVQLVKGPNTLTITSSKSSRDGFNVPFAPKDASDLSVALSQLEFRPVQERAGVLYGPQPANFLRNTYASAGKQGLTLFVRRPEAQQLHYRLLRRFEHQSFDFYLDGQLVGSLPAQTPGTLLVGQFKLPQADSPGVRSVSVSSRALASPIKLATTAHDSPDVQFYVQQLNVTAEGTAAAALASVLVAPALAALLACFFWWLLFRRQRS